MSPDLSILRAAVTTGSLYPSIPSPRPFKRPTPEDQLRQHDDENEAGHRPKRAARREGSLDKNARRQQVLSAMPGEEGIPNETNEAARPSAREAEDEVHEGQEDVVEAREYEAVARFLGSRDLPQATEAPTPTRGEREEEQHQQDQQDDAARSPKLEGALTKRKVRKIRQTKKDKENMRQEQQDIQYAVSKILGHQVDSGGVQLLVQWGGKWHKDQPTWEQEHELWDTCREKVLDYWCPNGWNCRTRRLELDRLNGPFVVHRIIKDRKARQRRSDKGHAAETEREYLVDFVGYAKPEWQPADCLPHAVVQEWKELSC